MCLDGKSEGCGLDRRDFLIGGAAAFAGLGALGAEGAAQKKEQPATRVLDDPGIQHGKVTFKHGGKNQRGRARLFFTHARPPGRPVAHLPACCKSPHGDLVGLTNPEMALCGCGRLPLPFFGVLERR